MSIFARLAEVREHLVEAAQQVDRSPEPPRWQMEMLASTGYFAYVSDATAPDRRRLLDTLSSGCGTTAFLSSQHEAVCRRLFRARHRLFENAARGDEWFGVCFAHLRRDPSPVSVIAQDDGLRFDGVGPWFSGLGLMERVMVAGASPEGEFLMAVCPVVSPGITAGTAPALAVMNATATVPLTFDGLLVPIDDLIVRTNAREMNEAAMHSTVFQAARSLGVARAAAGFLPCTAADQLLARIERQHEKMDAWDLSTSWPAATALRKEAIELAAVAVQTALVCVGGQAHALGHPVQRLAREASFYATTQLTAELREAYLDQLKDA